MKERLLPCPFCGSNEISFRKHLPLHIYCSKCGASTLGFSEDTEYKVIWEAWNKRNIHSSRDFEYESQLLTSEPRELSLEEIAVAAMVAWINSQGTIKTIGDLANWSYDIAEAMKAEKERREKKSEERDG